MKVILLLVFIASAVVFFSGVSLDSGLGERTVGLALVAFVVLFAYLKRSGKDGEDESILPKVAKATLAIAGILMFVINRSNGNFAVMGPLLGGILLVAITLYGIFIMFSGKPKKRRRR